VAANFNSVRTIDFLVERSGGSDILHSDVADEIFCIAREALTNAFRHSEASRIVIELDYQKDEFRMSRRDNGRGFNAFAQSANATNGHWGLRGMAKRADQGTEIRVRVPARLAYARTGRFGQLFGSQRSASSSS
jgi:signal transduction histidine kinase